MQQLLSLTLALPLLSASSILLTPHKPGFLLYDTVSLRCEDAPWWTVRRRTSSGGVRTCLSGWGAPGGAVSECLIKNLYPSDIGTYWCESESGEKSATVHIYITGNLTTVSNVSELEPIEGTVTSNNEKTLHFSLSKELMNVFPPDSSSSSSSSSVSTLRLLGHLLVSAPYLVSTVLLGLIYRDHRAAETQRSQRSQRKRRRQDVMMEIQV